MWHSSYTMLQWTQRQTHKPTHICPCPCFNWICGVYCMVAWALTGNDYTSHLHSLAASFLHPVLRKAWKEYFSSEPLHLLTHRKEFTIKACHCVYYIRKKGIIISATFCFLMWNVLCCSCVSIADSTRPSTWFMPYWKYRGHSIGRSGWLKKCTHEPIYITNRLNDVLYHHDNNLPMSDLPLSRSPLVSYHLFY